MDARRRRGRGARCSGRRPRSLQAGQRPRRPLDRRQPAAARRAAHPSRSARQLRGRAYDAHDVGEPNALDEPADVDDRPSRRGSRSRGSAATSSRSRGARRPDPTIARRRWPRPRRSRTADRGARPRRRGSPARRCSSAAASGSRSSPGDASDAATLLSQAEGALARAKQAGRNQARRHGDDATRTGRARRRAADRRGRVARRARNGPVRRRLPAEVRTRDVVGEPGRRRATTASRMVDVARARDRRRGAGALAHAGRRAAAAAGFRPARRVVRRHPAARRPDAAHGARRGGALRVGRRRAASACPSTCRCCSSTTARSSRPSPPRCATRVRAARIDARVRGDRVRRRRPARGRHGRRSCRRPASASRSTISAPAPRGSSP